MILRQRPGTKDWIATARRTTSDHHEGVVCRVVNRRTTFTT